MNILLFFSNFLLQKCQKSRQRLFFFCPSFLHPNKVRQIQNYLLQEIYHQRNEFELHRIDHDINQRYTFQGTYSLPHIDRIPIQSHGITRPIIVAQRCVRSRLLNA